MTMQREKAVAEGWLEEMIYLVFEVFRVKIW